MAVKITSDSTCDLTADLVAAHDIEIVPLSIVKDGRPYRDGVEITPADIFRHVDAGGDITTTAAVSVGEYHDVFERLSPRYEAVIHITSSPGSGGPTRRWRRGIWTTTSTFSAAA